MLGTALVGWFGFERVADATVSVGAWGFTAICAWQLVLFAVLGLAGTCCCRADRSWRVWVLVWGRMVRDAAGTACPFSLVGGFVLGARAVTLHGVPWPAAAASTVVDVTAEFLAQIGLVLIGVLILSTRSPSSSMILPVCLGLIAALIAGLASVWLQRGATSPLMRLSHRMLGNWIQRRGEPDNGDPDEADGDLR